MVVTDKMATDDESFRQTVRLRLFREGEIHAELTAISEQLAEKRQIMRCRDNQNVPDPRQHQHAQRVIDHRLIIDRKKLLRNGYRQGIEACSASTGEDNAFHLRSI